MQLLRIALLALAIVWVAPARAVEVRAPAPAAVEQVRVLTRTTVAVARPTQEGQRAATEPLRKPLLRKPSYARR